MNLKDMLQKHAGIKPKPASTGRKSPLSQEQVDVVVEKLASGVPQRTIHKETRVSMYRITQISKHLKEAAWLIK